MPATIPDRPAAPRDADDPAACVVCGARTRGIEVCCSRSCVFAARREVQRNLARLRWLHRRGAHEGRHPQELVRRNGRLVAALLQWRPPAQRAEHDPVA